MNVYCFKKVFERDTIMDTVQINNAMMFNRVVYVCNLYEVINIIIMFKYYQKYVLYM